MFYITAIQGVYKVKLTPKYERVEDNTKTSKEHSYLQVQIRVPTITHKYPKITTREGFRMGLKF